MTLGMNSWNFHLTLCREQRERRLDCINLKFYSKGLLIQADTCLQADLVVETNVFNSRASLFTCRLQQWWIMTLFSPFYSKNQEKSKTELNYLEKFLVGQKWSICWDTVKQSVIYSSQWKAKSHHWKDASRPSPKYVFPGSHHRFNVIQIQIWFKDFREWNQREPK